MKLNSFAKFALASTLAVSATVAVADQNAERGEDGGRLAGIVRGGLPDHAALQTALRTVVNGTNGGFGLNMWLTVVNRDGIVTGIAFSGNDRGDQWPGSRVISAQKANTANSFSLKGLPLSTANL